jgi:flavin-dependent dehydrogenase
VNKEHFDVVIIGAGPSGSVASAMLGRAGRSVLVIEKQYFPRFSIGESLLPQCMAFLAQAGLEKTVHDNAKANGFQFKNGAAFHKKGQNTEFNFTQKFSEGPGTTYQVKRASFDKILADGAADAGAKIRYGHEVKTVDVNCLCPTLEILDEQGKLYQVESKFLLDASGFARVLPRMLSLEKPSHLPTRTSYFTHVEDNIECSSFDRDKILITVNPNDSDIWYWLIPFADGTSSIGVVGKPEQFSPNDSPEVILKHFIRVAPNLNKLLENAKWHNEVNKLGGYSADVTHLAAKNYALLGNAGEFLDPVFSSGVTIALCSAVLIAPQVIRYLDGESVDFEQSFALPLKKGVDCFKTFVNSWYESGFQDVIFYQEQDSNVKAMISSILAGYAWDEANPYVAQSERRFKTLVALCQ